MFDSIAEIRVQLSQGEDEHAEFKEIRFGDHSVVSPTTESIAGEIVAFANAAGGTLFFGIADDSRVCGIPDQSLDIVEHWAKNIATHNCDPPVRVIVRRVSLEDDGGRETAIVCCDVPGSPTVHRSSGGRYYVRAQALKRDLTASELSKLFQERGRHLASDEQPVRTATLEDLDVTALRGHFHSVNGVPWPDLLLHTKVLTRDETGTPRPSLAAMLAFGKTLQEHAPFATIEAAAYRDVDKSSGRLTHAEKIAGPAASQIEGALEFIRYCTGRDGATPYPLDALEEAIRNAVQHRDYGRVGSKIRMLLFVDRLELSSPGRPPNTVTLQSLPYRVYKRNQLLASFLTAGNSNGGRQAHGVGRLLAACEAHTGRLPEYRLQGDDLLLMVWPKPRP